MSRVLNRVRGSMISRAGSTAADCAAMLAAIARSDPRHVHLTAEASKHSSRSVSVARGPLGASLNRSFRGPRREFQNRSRSAPAEPPRAVRARENSRHVDGADGLSQCFAISYVDCPPALRVFCPSPEKYSRLAPDL